MRDLFAVGANDLHLDADVIVAGAGPVGLSLAVALQAKGHRVMVVEALDALSDEARASTFHPPTLEMFGEWGVLSEVLAKGRAITHLQFWERETRELVADFPYALIAGDTSCPFRLQCPQSVVTRLLRPRREALGGSILFGHEVVSATSDLVAGHATVRAQTSQRIRTFRARYVVGADGSKSRVRESLGLTLTGTTYPDRFLLVGTDIDFAPIFPGMGPVSYVFDPREWVIVMHLPDVVRVVFRLGSDDANATDDAIKDEASVRARIARFVGREVAYGIQSVSTYSVHQRVAERFRDGRVLLAGDAAHINNPAGGMGMNSGIHDAHVLANAIDQALSTGDERPLDAYADTRRAVAVDGVQKASDASYRDLVARETAAREARNRSLRESASDPAKARAYLLRASMLEERIAPRASTVVAAHAGAP